MTRLVPWLYVSTTQIDPLDAAFQVELIVKVARSRNASLGVTGALICSGSRFLQFIEGAADSVEALRQSILVDPRHKDIVTIDTPVNDERLFAGWSLAYSGRSHFIEAQIDKTLMAAVVGGRPQSEPAMRLLKELV